MGQTRKLRASLSAIEEAGATVAVVVPHEVCRTKWWSDRAGDRLPVLADGGFLVSSMYGVAFQMRIHTDTSNTPGTFLIDRDGVLRWAHIGTGAYNWRDRPTVEKILEEVKQLER